MVTGKKLMQLALAGVLLACGAASSVQMATAVTPAIKPEAKRMMFEEAENVLFSEDETAENISYLKQILDSAKDAGFLESFLDGTIYYGPDKSKACSLIFTATMNKKGAFFKVLYEATLALEEEQKESRDRLMGEVADDSDADSSESTSIGSASTSASTSPAMMSPHRGSLSRHRHVVKPSVDDSHEGVPEAMDRIVQQIKNLHLASRVKKQTELRNLVDAYNRKYPGRGISAAQVEAMNKEVGLVLN